MRASVLRLGKNGYNPLFRLISVVWTPFIEGRFRFYMKEKMWWQVGPVERSLLSWQITSIPRKTTEKLPCREVKTCKGHQIPSVYMENVLEALIRRPLTAIIHPGNNPGSSFDALHNFHRRVKASFIKWNSEWKGALKWIKMLK